MQKWSRVSYYHIIIDCIDKQEIEVGAKKRKDLEIELQKMFEINKKFQVKKKRFQTKSDIERCYSP